MVKHTQTIRLQQTNGLGVFNQFVTLALKGLKNWFIYRVERKLTTTGGP